MNVTELDDLTTGISEWITKLTGVPYELVINIIDTFLTILILWIIYKLVFRILKKSVDDTKKLYKWRKNLHYLFVTIGFLIIGQVWLFQFQSLGTFLGLFSAGLAIALKDPISSFFGWIFILWRKPFETGDRIEIGNHTGDIVDIRIFSFKLIEIGNWVDGDQTTGRTIAIPNSRIFIDPLANYTIGFNYIWNEIPVLVTFESNWHKAKEILGRIVIKNAEKYSVAAEKEILHASEKIFIQRENVNPTVYTSVKNSGVMLTLRFVCIPRKRRGLEQAIWEDILEEFSKCSDIDFAYPTTRFYNNQTEGK